MFPSIMSFKIAKAIVPVDQADAHLTGLWAALRSLLELLLDLSKSLNYLLSRRGVKASVPDSNSGDPRSIRGRRCHRSSLVEFHPDLKKF